MVDAVLVAKTVGGLALAGGILLLIYMAISYMVGAIIKYQGSRSDAGSMWYKFPKWLFPNKKIHDWVGYPATFSVAENQTVTTSEFIKELSNVTPEDCMLACAGEEDCVGLIQERTATGNNCTLVSFMDGLTPSTSNSIYIVDGLTELVKYTKYDLKVPAAPAAIPITSIVVPTLSNLATVTTTTVHPFTTGQVIKVAGNPTVNGSNAVTVLDSSRFTFPYVTPTDISSVGGTATLVMSSLPPWSHATDTAAQANCISQEDCTGFVFNPVGGADNYIPFTVELDPTKFIVSTTSNTYVLGASTFTKSNLEYY
jgi:hypothetical protein